MSNNYHEDFFDKLQADSNNDAQKAYGRKGYERWLNPKYCGTMECPDGDAKLTGECGDTMHIFVKMDGEIVQDASYCTDGCASSSICGSFAAELAIGKSAEEILDMNGQTILAELDSFPEGERHCAHLAVTTLKEAIHKYMSQII